MTKWKKFEHDSYYIPSVDGKDLYIALHYANPERRSAGYSLSKADGSHNLNKYTNTLDYSLDRMKLQELYEKTRRRLDFCFTENGKPYCNKVINVTFKYSVAEFNLAGRNTYVRFGQCERDLEFVDCVAFVNGVLCGIVTGVTVEHPVSPELVAPYFKLENGKYEKAKGFPTLCTTADVREYLYEHGFDVGGEHYVRWKRSAGSSRVGKCLFIVEDMYPRMHKWEMCGFRVGRGDPVDLAALEAYISLPLSSIVGTLDIPIDSIAVVDDYESVFNDEVISVEEDSAADSGIRAVKRTCEIANCIWDGEGLIDQSAMGTFADKGFVLLRNRFFKCAAFNTNLQQWFVDNGITEVSQLNCRTRAKTLADIKLVTTPQSIKYLKFGTLDKWLDTIDSTFGVVKYEKPTKILGGRMVQAHYQLLNTLQLTEPEVAEFMRPTFDYITQLRTDPAVLRNHIRYMPDEFDPYEAEPANSRNDIVWQMLGITDRFTRTQIYRDFVGDCMKSMLKSCRLGHVWVDGCYATLFGNPMEFLRQLIGRFDGTSSLGVDKVHTKRFDYGERILGVRSPHISMNSVWCPENVASPEIDRYFNLTPQIVCIDSINNNILCKLSGCD